MDIEKQIFADIFNFLKINFNGPFNRDHWVDIDRQTTELEKKYKGNQFAMDMLIACTRRLCEIGDKGA